MLCPESGKQCFDGKAEALAALDHLRRAGANVSHVYRCECRYWHLAGIRSASYTHRRKRNHRRKGGAFRRKARGREYRPRR